jgi:nucleoside phosphorylase
MGENIYYHFFDRELRQSVKASISDEEICKIISVSLLMSDGIFYFPISHFYESYSEFPKSFRYIKLLESLGIVNIASGHDSVENFILSRQEMYKHDKARYPMYFNDISSIWSSNLIVLENSTTEILRNKFIRDRIIIKEMDDDKVHFFNKTIKNIVENDKNKAITYSLFKNKIPIFRFRKAAYDVITNQLRMQISNYYTQRYLEVTSGTIITNINSIRRYDFLAKNDYLTNYRIYAKILKITGANIDSPSFLNLVLSLRKEKILFEVILQKLNCLMQSLSNLLGDKKFGIINEYDKYLYSDKKYSEINDPFSFYRNILLYIDDISNNHKGLSSEIEIINNNKKSLVIVVVTETELKALFNTIKVYCPRQFLINKIVDDLMFWELIGCKLPVYIVQSEMGISGSGSIINTINKVHTYLKPEKILMVGIAFGINEEKQKIGDVLVSKQVWNYEQCKKTETENISRGDKIPASIFLLQLFRSIKLEYNINVHFGLLASGEKLINSREFLLELKIIEKELIGGDMEAAGLASVCIDKHIEWLVIKAICDWGHDKDSQFQFNAADNACNFLMKGLVKIIL